MIQMIGFRRIIFHVNLENVEFSYLFRNKTHFIRPVAPCLCQPAVFSPFVRHFVGVVLPSRHGPGSGDPENEKI